MNILITGSTGFIGYHLTEYLLKKNYKITCLIRNEKKTRLFKHSENLTFLKVSLDKIQTLDCSFFRKFDYIYHFAGLTKTYNPYYYYKTNYWFTKILIDKIIESKTQKLKRFIYCSSQAAAGPSSAFKKTKESDFCFPITNYGKSKLLSEKYLETKKTELNYIIVRPPAVFGPLEKDISEYYKMVKKNIMPIIGNGKSRFSIIYVEDLVDLSVKLSENLNIKSGEIFFICEDNDYSFEEFGNIISKVMNKKCKKIYIPLFIVRILGNINSVISKTFKITIMLNKEKLKEIKQKYWICSNEKLKKFYYSYKFTDIKLALKKTIDPKISIKN